MKSIKFYKILSLTLLVLNIVTLSVFYYNRPPDRPNRGEARLAKDIGMTGAVKKKVDALEIQHHKNKRALTRQNFTLQKRLYSSLSNDERADSLQLKIKENRAEIDRMTYEFFSEVASLCNKKQREELEATIHNCLRRITGGGGPPPRR